MCICVDSRLSHFGTQLSVMWHPFNVLSHFGTQLSLMWHPYHVLSRFGTQLSGVWHPYHVHMCRLKTVTLWDTAVSNVAPLPCAVTLWDTAVRKCGTPPMCCHTLGHSCQKMWHPYHVHSIDSRLTVTLRNTAVIMWHSTLYQGVDSKLTAKL